MGDISKNLDRAEFRCPCGKCKETPVDVELPQVLQDCVDHFAHLEHGRSLMFQRVACTISEGGGYRCPDYNASVKDASPTSKHMLGMAADHKMEWVYGDGTRKQIPPDDIADYYEHRYPNQYGIGRYNTFTHVDTRKHVARWDYRT